MRKILIRLSVAIIGVIATAAPALAKGVIINP